MAQLFSLQNFDKKVAPYVKNGVIVDTCFILELMKGIIRTQRGSTDTDGWKKEYEKIINLLDSIKTDWKKMFLTPHVMTETCSHFNSNHNTDPDFQDIVRHIMDFVETTQERQVAKKDFVKLVDYKVNMSLEPGDLSIYAIADLFAVEKKRIAILTIDEGFSARYAKSPYVMVIDYRFIEDLEAQV